jgi:hypothetical protein
MKKLSLLFTLAAIGFITVAFSQNDSYQNAREEVKQYFDSNIFPALEKQQIIYIDKLSDAEKVELRILNEKTNNGSKKVSRQSGNYNRRSDSNKENANIKKTMRYDMQNDIKEITNAHPKLNDSYSKFIKKNMQAWIIDIKAIHDKNNIEQMRNKDDHTGIDMFFERASNPDWLLLWDPLNPRISQSRAMRQQDGNNNIKRGSVKRNRNPQLRDEIKMFAVENIIPVIAEERKAFDKVLSNNDREAISTARQKIQVRKLMFKNWYESDDFVAGKRAKDSNFDGMRTDMQNSMTKVREIAIAHGSEIKEYTNRIKSHVTEWEKELIIIAENNNQNADDVMRMTRQHMRKSNTPIAFLLFNPDKATEADFFKMEEEIKVIVYPNPVVHSATIAIIGAGEKNILVTLFSKEGETINTLFNGMNTEQRLEVALNSTELNNNVYIIKVETDGAEIARKIVVKK